MVIKRSAGMPEADWHEYLAMPVVKGGKRVLLCSICLADPTKNTGPMAEMPCPVVAKARGTVSPDEEWRRVRDGLLSRVSSS